jgi:hypothetical protein
MALYFEKNYSFLPITVNTFFVKNEIKKTNLNLHSEECDAGEEINCCL